ncbi:MAG: hypothetical protein MJ067_00825 [Oscillospiraceae bacterium]|nr:hypothetical protein [Oscillospiraceae bacterium]
MAFMNNEGGEFAKYFVQTSPGPAMDGDFKKIYDKFAHRILWMDGNVCPGAFQMNTAWYTAVPERDPIFTEHKHDDTSELVCFFSSDEKNPYDLGGEIEFSIEGEPHLLTKSTMIYVPAGLRHNPMRILRVDRPIFHCSIVMKDSYDEDSTYR